MAQHMEGAHGLAEGAGHIRHGAPLDEGGAQGLVLALPGLQEEPTASTYVYWCAYSHAL
jgi:hypothetical protein